MKRYFKKKIHHIIFVVRNKNLLSEYAPIKSWLKKRNVNSHAVLQGSLNTRTKRKTDLIVVLGGDGTYLSSVAYAHKCSIPILGINMGSLGFLTIHTKDRLYSCMDKMLKGSMELVERGLLDVCLKNASGKVEKRSIALNDVVIERGKGSKLISIAVHVQKRFIYSLKADGLIISSPTGSTAYNLAAGGPILHPKVEAVVVTPICPHILTHRPVIFSADHLISFQLENLSKRATLITDGQKMSSLNKSSCITVRKSKKKHLALRDPLHSEFAFLKDKFGFFDRMI